MLQRLCFHFFSLQFQIVSNTFGANALKTLFSKCCLQFQIVLNTVTMHALDVHCFQLFLCSSKFFQIPPECMLWRHCFHFFSAVPNRFKCRQNACFRDIIFKEILGSPKSFQIVSECMFQRYYFQKGFCGSESFQIRQNVCVRDIAGSAMVYHGGTTVVQ